MPNQTDAYCFVIRILKWSNRYDYYSPVRARPVSQPRHNQASFQVNALDSRRKGCVLFCHPDMSANRHELCP